MNNTFQSCLTAIKIEPNKWKNHGGKELQVTKYYNFNQPQKSIAIRDNYNELRITIKCLMDVNGKEVPVATVAAESTAMKE